MTKKEVIEEVKEEKEEQKTQEKQYFMYCYVFYKKRKPTRKVWLRFTDAKADGNRDVIIRKEETSKNFAQVFPLHKLLEDKNRYIMYSRYDDQLKRFLSHVKCSIQKKKTELRNQLIGYNQDLLFLKTGEDKSDYAPQPKE